MLNIEKIAARKYYGGHAIGTVILVDGQPAFHGLPKDANGFFDRISRITSDTEKIENIFEVIKKSLDKSK